MKQEHINEIKAIIVLCLGMILFASLISYVPDDLIWYTSHPNVPVKNLIRIFGAYLAGGLFFVFGYSSYILAIFLFFWSWNKFSNRDIVFTFSKFISFIVLFCVGSAWLSVLGPQQVVDRFSRAGVVGIIISDFLVQYVGITGTYIILTMLGLMAFILTGEFLVTPLFIKCYERLKEFVVEFKNRKQLKIPAALNGKTALQAKLKPKINIGNFLSPKDKVLSRKEIIDEKEELKKILGKNSERVKEEMELGSKEDEKSSVAPKIRIAEQKKIVKESGGAQMDEEKEVGAYKLPSMDLLDDPPQIKTNEIESTLVNEAKLLENTLLNFGVNARVVDVERGPAITRYELEPAPGVKVQKFTTLENDIALAMRAATVRIVAPIPGKNRVGVEVPNSSSASVFLKEVLASDEFRKSKSKLTLALGKDIAGKPMLADLAEMPHLLIAGTTGSGKSVCVNGIIVSILLNATPDEVKFVMVDPKMVELNIYKDIPHLLCPPVTDTRKAAGVLNWVVVEMESRYQRLSKAGVKNILGYNEISEEKIPYIVVIIDELADLMQVSAKGVESSITRLAQLSRAVGIHLILATQRPSVNVITGVIKANFPARISFKVASKVDSRTVLDMNGAESLLGKGDMLFIKPGDAKPTRGQGNYVNDKEINRVLDEIKGQREPEYDDTILQQQKTGGVSGTGGKDECYDEAVKLVVETNQASVSIIQRRMRLGYTRAARLIDMMEEAGIVGPYVGSKPRDILVDREQWLLEHASEGEKANEQQ